MFVENIEVSTLANGIRVVSETVTHVQSIALGIWVGVGSRDEDAPVRGITHFIEHMLFKGTERRGPREIADEIESRGGSLNAFTDKEYTCYYARALAEHAEIAFDVLSDMVRFSVLDPEELEREKNVVIEEIKRYEDTPEDTVHDVFARTLWPNHPLGKCVIGSAKTVATLTPAALRDHIDQHYSPGRIVVAASGNVTHAELVALSERMMGGASGSEYARRERPPKASGAGRKVRKRTEQVHFCLGGPAFRQTDDDRYALTILDAALGGNMSSRLFQEIREKRGLAYSIGSYAVSYGEAGLFTVFGGTSPSTFEEVLDLTRTELTKVVNEGLTDDEMMKAQTQIRGALVLGLESMSSRMMRMGKSLLYFGHVIPLNEIVDRVAQVNRDDIARVAERVMNPETLSLAAIGPFGRSECAAPTMRGGSNTDA